MFVLDGVKMVSLRFSTFFASMISVKNSPAGFPTKSKISDPKCHVKGTK